LTTTIAHDETESGDEDEREPFYPNSAAWVAQWLCTTLEREPKRTFDWCSSWWDHPEAVQRLEALWLAWEHLRLDPGDGMSTWWVDHADPHLAVLCNPDVGPFGQCHTAHRSDIAPLHSDPIPDNRAGEPVPAMTDTTSDQGEDNA
jgi:hypothetical protein